MMNWFAQQGCLKMVNGRWRNCKAFWQAFEADLNAAFVVLPTDKETNPCLLSFHKKAGYLSGNRPKTL
jgi:hypothetical protein